jgi:dCMP deaminase
MTIALYNIFFEECKEYSKSKEDFIEKTSIPSWKEYFLMMAKLSSFRSKDAQTKHGCVITDINNRVLGMGYNSFPRGLPDKSLPNKRPHKYKWMVHAERNALSNCSLRPERGVAYITGRPCLECLKSLYQEGVTTIVCLDAHSTYATDEEDKKIFDIFTKSGYVDIEVVEEQTISEVFKKLLV